MILTPSQVCGHRGAAEKFPENTLAGFEAAHAVGVGLVETDIQMLADGELVLFHDERLGRTVSGDAPIAELCWNDVASLDVGSWKGAQFSDQRILRVKDLLDWQKAATDAPSIIWEMKLSPNDSQTRTFNAAQAVSRELYGLDHTGHMLTSFNRMFITYVRPLLPKMPMALSSVEFPKDWKTFCQVHKLEALHLDGTRLTEKQAKLVKDAGLILRCYTINDPALAKRLFDWGVDTIFTDSPDVFLE